MRLLVGLLACLGAGAVISANADPPTNTASEAIPAAVAPAPAAPAPASTPDATAAATNTAAAQAAAHAAAAKAELDSDTRHFLALGYKPEVHNGEQIYCRKEIALGSRLTQVKNCGTIEELKLAEVRTKSGVSDAQRQQTGTSFH